MEELEKQEKKKKMREEYLIKMRKKEEDEKKLKEIKLRQEMELKQIKELKNKKKIEEEKLNMILQGRLNFDKNEIINYKQNFDSYKNNINQNFFDNEDISIKSKLNVYKTINNNEIKLINKLNNYYDNDDDDDNNRNEYITINKNKNSKKNLKLNLNYDDEKDEKNIKNNIINKDKINKISNINPSILYEKELGQNSYPSLSPTLSNKLSTGSLNLKKNFEKYNYKTELISLQQSKKEENDLINKYLTNNPDNKSKIAEKEESNYYDIKKKKYLKSKKSENKYHHKTNIYNDKKIFEKLMNKNNKENDANEINIIKEMTAKARNEIDNTLQMINTDRVGMNPYLKYGKKNNKHKKDYSREIKNFKGYNETFDDKVKFVKYFKEMYKENKK